MKEFVKKLCSDNNGNPSSMRVVFLFFGLTFSAVLVTVYGAVSLYNKEVSEVPAGVVAILGTLLVGKSIQKGVEVYGETKGGAGNNSLDIDPSKQ